MRVLSVAALVCSFAAVLSCDRVQSQSAGAMSKARAIQAAGLTRTAYELRGTSQNYAISAFEVNGDGSNGAPGTVQPGVSVWDADRDEMLSDRQINMPPNGNFTTTTGKQADHDEPTLARTPDNALLALYGANSTYYRNHPPSAWACPSGFCEPFKFAAPSDANGPKVADALANSQEYLIPSVGLSETSAATLGDVTIIAGQQQPNSRYGQPGAQGYVTLHASQTFDTAAGPWAFRSSHTPPADGLETLTLTPFDDSYVDFGIVQASPGSGAISISVAGASCSQSITSNGDAASVAQTFASNFASTCSALSGKLSAMQVRYDPTLIFQGRPLVPAAVGLFAKNGDSQSLPSIREVILNCSGAISCGGARGLNAVNDQRTGGRHRHYLFGGAIHFGRYIYYVMDTEILTGTWFGAAHNGYGLALACFRSSGPSGARWTWTNCSGRYPFSVAPGQRATGLLQSPDSPYFLRPPVNGYPSNMTPYIYDMRMAAQPPFNGSRNYPVTSAKWVTGLSDGDLMIAHGCQTRSGNLSVCYAILDPANDKTTLAGVVAETTGGGSLASVALRTTQTTVDLAVLVGLGSRWGCGTDGTCLIIYRFHAPDRTWQRISTQSLGGDRNAGFPGFIAPSDRGFVAQVRQRLSGIHATLQTFEKVVQ